MGERGLPTSAHTCCLTQSGSVLSVSYTSESIRRPSGSYNISCLLPSPPFPLSSLLFSWSTAGILCLVPSLTTRVWRRYSNPALLLCPARYPLRWHSTCAGPQRYAFFKPSIDGCGTKPSFFFPDVVAWLSLLELLLIRILGRLNTRQPRA